MRCESLSVQLNVAWILFLRWLWLVVVVLIIDLGSKYRIPQS
ncbi:hypothetical protein ACUOFC_47815, partial [Escherichia sp. TWPC-MK]